jgi:uncharacterized membrane protein
MVIENPTKDGVQILLRPNRSATWTQTKYMIYGIGLISMLIAVYWLTIGAWLVLPFIGLEILGLAILARIVCANSFSQDLLTINNEQVTVTYGKQMPEKHWHFSLADTELLIIRPHHALSPHQLKLKDDKKVLAIGRYLNKADIDKLIKCLLQTQLTIRFTGQIKTRSIDGFKL